MTTRYSNIFTIILFLSFLSAPGIFAQSNMGNGMMRNNQMNNMGKTMQSMLSQMQSLMKNNRIMNKSGMKDYNVSLDISHSPVTRVIKIKCIQFIIVNTFVLC